MLIKLNRVYYLNNNLFNVIVINNNGTFNSFGNINNMRLYIYTEDGIILNPIINISLI